MFLTTINSLKRQFHMKIKKYTASFLLMFICMLLVAQHPQFRAWNASDSAYGDAMRFPTKAVAEDFGPRRIGDNFHGGVDYNSSQDDGDADKSGTSLIRRKEVPR